MKLFLVSILVISGYCFGAEKIELILYSLPNCIPCQYLKKTLNEMNIKWVDGVGEQGAYPTLIIVINNVEKHRFIGYVTKEEIRKVINETP